VEATVEEKTAAAIAMVAPCRGGDNSIHWHGGNSRGDHNSHSGGGTRGGNNSHLGEAAKETTAAIQMDATDEEAATAIQVGAAEEKTAAAIWVEAAEEDTTTTI
jgi:hypothetical protein